jgi:sirohydrochlorin ferrochelatase
MIKEALIVSHGQPSDPEPAEAALALLAAKVAALLPDWRVHSATLAKPDALAAVVAGRPRGVVYPMFMAGGWFPMTELPRRMTEAGGVDWAYLPPFGLDARVQDLVVTLAQEAATAQGRTVAQTDVLLAAHGSFRSSAPSEVAQAVAQRLKRAGFARAEAFFIDQEPRIATATGFGAGSVCLPFFAAEGAMSPTICPKPWPKRALAGRRCPPWG